MVESSRRDFLKMFGIGAAVVAAPNVFVSPQLEATMTYVPEVAVAETIDPMKLYYHLGDKKYSLGKLRMLHVPAPYPQRFETLGYTRSFVGRRMSAPPLEMSIHADVSDLRNYHEIFMQMMESRIPLRQGELVGHIDTKDFRGRSIRVHFNAPGFLQSYSECEIVGNEVALTASYAYDQINIT